jgi:hypothetical protein
MSLLHKHADGLQLDVPSKASIRAGIVHSPTEDIALVFLYTVDNSGVLTTLVALWLYTVDNSGVLVQGHQPLSK